MGGIEVIADYCFCKVIARVYVALYGNVYGSEVKLAFARCVSVRRLGSIYLRENGDYEILALNANSIGADAGKYTARIKPSSVYDLRIRSLPRPP